DEVFADPQVRHIGIARAVEHPRRGRQELVGQAVDMNRTPWRCAQPRPKRVSTRTPCSPRLATIRRQSPICARAAWCERLCAELTKPLALPLVCAAAAQ